MLNRKRSRTDVQMDKTRTLVEERFRTDILDKTLVRREDKIVFVLRREFLFRRNDFDFLRGLGDVRIYARGNRMHVCIGEAPAASERRAKNAEAATEEARIFDLRAERDGYFYLRLLHVEELFEYSKLSSKTYVKAVDDDVVLATSKQ